MSKDKTDLHVPRSLLQKVKVKVCQSYPALCDLMHYTVSGILQARILEWVAVLFCRGSSQPRDRTRSPALQADSLPAEPAGKPILNQFLWGGAQSMMSSKKFAS